MKPNEPQNRLEALGEQDQPGLVAELVAFLMHNKKWWLVPIFLVLAIFGLLAALASSSVAPFLYNLW